MCDHLTLSKAHEFFFLYLILLLILIPMLIVMHGYWKAHFHLAVLPRDRPIWVYIKLIFDWVKSVNTNDHYSLHSL